MRIEISILFLFFVNAIFAQQYCGFEAIDSLHNHNDHSNFERLLGSRQQRTTDLGEDDFYLVPVVVHVVHSNSTDVVGLGNNISDNQILSAIEVLNEDFRRQNADTIHTPDWARTIAADMQIEFRLATQDPDGNPTSGITRHRATESSFSLTRDSEIALKTYGYWPSNDYLNVWVAKLSSNIVGYAQFPDSSSLIGVDDYNGGALTDGIVLAPYAFGRLTGLANGLNNPYRLGRTVVHEVGHWLGLRHIFNNNPGGCNYTDYCEDTPPQDESSIGEDNPEAVLIGGCGEVVLHQNYMDYTDDIAMNLFTENQKTRAHKVMEVSPRRAALKYSKGLCGSSMPISLPFEEDFEEELTVPDHWEQYSSNTDFFNWFLEDGMLNSGGEDSLSTDSVVLKSGSFMYESDGSFILRFDVQSNNLDSIKVYFERSCSGEKIFFTKIELKSSELVNVKLDLNGKIDNGLLQIYFVAYNNGNEISLDNINIYQESEKIDFVFYPNPSNGEVTMDLKLPTDQDLLFEVYTDIGKKIVWDNWHNVHSDLLDIDLSNLQAGFYIAKITGENESKTFRFVIR